MEQIIEQLNSGVLSEDGLAAAKQSFLKQASMRTVCLLAETLKS